MFYALKIRANLYHLWTATPLPPANPGIKFVNKTHFLTPRVSPICHCLSALESGRIKLSLQPVELRTLAEKVLADLKTPADAKGVKLINDLPDLTATADVNRLEQVLANLVDNAIKYGRAQGTVTVGGEKTGDGKIEIFVQDDGPGIPTEALDRVFERFYRVDKARSREQGGTGLGLSIVKHIVQNHGGRVWVKSEPGKGAAFFFTLPAVKQD
jgi:two-component system phosphate regulon sensor histidine kinase PhoR